MNAGNKALSENGLNLIKSFEGLRLTAYKCLETEKYYTIGYGHYGSDVQAGQTITEEEAVELLKYDVARFEAHVNCYDASYDFTQNQFDALVSFAYNIGSIKQLTQDGTRTCEQIVAAMPLYCHAGGVKLSGLVNRRNLEVALFNTPDSTPTNITDVEQFEIDYETLVSEIISGKWGNGNERKEKLAAAGYDYTYVQSLVNQALNANKTSTTDIDDIAKLVIRGYYGNGETRKIKLTEAGYDYEKVQTRVNEMLKG